MNAAAAGKSSSTTSRSLNEELVVGFLVRTVVALLDKLKPFMSLKIEFKLEMIKTLIFFLARSNTLK